jgi:hypothetical protein
MNARTIGVVAAACAAVLGVQLAAGLLFFGGAVVNDVVVQPAAERQIGPGVVFNQVFDDVHGGQGKQVTRDELHAARGPVVSATKCKLTGPYTHDNLAIYLVHGPDKAAGQRVITLQSALEQRLAVVHEGMLAIDNFADAPIFIQGGDIIKGGTQDRVLPHDYLVPVGRNRQPLSVFCVEAGRSFPRGQEQSASFQSSTEQLPGNRLHLAARHRRNQVEVWNGVREVQLALARNVGGSVQSPLSQTSLQLTLESDRVQQAIQAYINELGPRTVGADDVIGVAVAVNGQIQSADTYASSGLFMELWPKLLRANAIAALADRQAGAAAPAPARVAVQQFLTLSEKGANCRRVESDGMVTLQQETERTLLYETCDPARQNAVLHRSFLAK